MSDWLLVEKQPVQVHARLLRERVEIPTREGVVVGKPDDFLMVGVDGEVYPCDPDIFDRTYRVVNGGVDPPTDVDVDLIDLL